MSDTDFYLKRRRFLNGALALSSGWVLGPRLAYAAAAVAPELLLSSHSEFATTNISLGPFHDRDVPGAARWLRPLDRAVQSIPTPFFAHAYESVPNAPHVLVGSAKWTPNAVVVDLRRRNVTKLLKAPEDYFFFGHLAFTKDGRRAFFTAHSNARAKGAILVYDVATWTLLKIVPSGGRAPHECTTLPSGELCVVNTISAKDEMKSEVVTMDPRTFEVRRAWTVPKVSHLKWLGDSEVALTGFNPVSASNLGALNLETGRWRDAYAAEGSPAAHLMGEGLSVDVMGHDLIVATVKDACTLLMWDRAKNQLKTRVYADKVYGLAADAKYLYLNEGPRGRLHRYGPDLEDTWAPFDFANGKHLRFGRDI